MSNIPEEILNDPEAKAIYNRILSKLTELKDELFDANILSSEEGIDRLKERLAAIAKEEIRIKTPPVEITRTGEGLDSGVKITCAWSFIQNATPEQAAAYGDWIKPVSEEEAVEYANKAIAYILSPEFDGKNTAIEGLRKAVKTGQSFHAKFLCLSTAGFPTEFVEKNRNILFLEIETEPLLEIETEPQNPLLLCFPIEMFPPEYIFYNHKSIIDLYAGQE